MNPKLAGRSYKTHPYILWIGAVPHGFYRTKTDAWLAAGELNRKLTPAQAAATHYTITSAEVM